MSGFVIASGYSVDPARMRLWRRADEIMARRRCCFVEAALLAEAETATVAPVGMQPDPARLDLLLEARRLMVLTPVDFAEAVRLAENARTAQVAVPLSAFVQLRVDRPEFVSLFAVPEVKLGAVPLEFSGTAYSGGPVQVAAGVMVIDLAGMAPPARIPVLLNHDHERIVGHSQVINTGVDLRLTQGRFSAVTPEGRNVAAMMGEGQPWALSIGVQGNYERVINSPVRINGRSFNDLDVVMRKARLLEVSFVPAGADPHAHAAAG